MEMIKKLQNKNGNKRMDTLLIEAANQYKVIKQIEKAIKLYCNRVCNKPAARVITDERIEAERLLLIALYKRQTTLSEIERFDSDTDFGPSAENNGSSSPSPVEKGVLILNEATFPLNTVNGISNCGCCRQWYMCIMSHGTQVIATTLTTLPPPPPPGRRCERIGFTQQFVFTDLKTDFTLHITLYCLLENHHQQSISSCAGLEVGGKYDFFANKKSLFQLSGQIELHVSDLSKVGFWQMSSLTSSSSPFLEMNIQSSIEVIAQHSGFLTISYGRKMIWERLWCKLDGHELRCWNYPNPLLEDQTLPLIRIDFIYCLNAHIEIVDRCMCPKPRTLLIEIGTKKYDGDYGNYKICKYFLTADNSRDLNAWQSQFNEVLSILHTWRKSVWFYSN